jgi:hypothetical protein
MIIPVVLGFFCIVLSNVTIFIIIIRFITKMYGSPHLQKIGRLDFFLTEHMATSISP